MNARDVVRTAVIATNPYWPFSSLNRVPYHAAVSAFVHLCKGYREIKSVYLRSGLVKRDWVPGLSDIDLTVITDAHLALDEEFTFLQAFWKQFDRLKPLFPMLGEIDILSEQNSGSWTRFGLHGSSARNWQRVYGVETLSCNYQFDNRQFSIDCLTNSLDYMHWYYRSHFGKKFVDRVESPFLLSKDLERLASKIIRCLAHFDQSEIGYKGRDDLFCGVISMLERGVLQFAAAEKFPATDNSWSEVFATRFQEPMKSEPLRTSSSDAWMQALETITVDSNNRFYFVLKNGVDPATLRTCVQNAENIAGQANPSIFILSACVFEYLLHYYEPFEYVHLLERRKIAFGKDPLRDVRPPAKDAFVNFLLHQIPNVLSYPQSRSFHAMLREHDAKGELPSMIHRSLFLKLYIDQGVVIPVTDSLIDQCEQRYPDWFGVLHAFKESPDEGSAFNVFTYLRSFANHVHKYLSQAST